MAEETVTLEVVNRNGVLFALYTSKDAAHVLNISEFEWKWYRCTPNSIQYTKEGRNMSLMFPNAPVSMRDTLRNMIKATPAPGESVVVYQHPPTGFF